MLSIGFIFFASGFWRWYVCGCPMKSWHTHTLKVGRVRVQIFRTLFTFSDQTATVCVRVFIPHMLICLIIYMTPTWHRPQYFRCGEHNFCINIKLSPASGREAGWKTLPEVESGKRYSYNVINYIYKCICIYICMWGNSHKHTHNHIPTYEYVDVVEKQ